MLRPKLFAKIILSWLLLGRLASAQTGNDSFSGRLTVHEGELFWAGVSGSTFEEFDPTQLFAWRFAKAGSKWWSWSAPRTGFSALARHPDASSFMHPPVFGVYTGTTLPTLSLVTWFEAVDELVHWPSFVGFNTTAGQTYSLGMVGESSNSLYAPFLITESDSPIILEGPASQSLIVGDTALFLVISPSLPAGHVQWQFKAVDILNATNSALTLEKITLDQAGIYTAIVEATNNEGVLKRTVSAPATLGVSGEILQPSISIRNPNAGVNEFFVKVLGQDQHWYDVESTRDFVTWQVEGIDFAGNTVDSGHEVQLPSSGFAQTKYLRARHLENLQQPCIANLKKLAFAKDLARIAHHHGIGDSVDLNELKEYIGEIPSCPKDETYTVNNYATPPTCPWAALGHMPRF